MSPATSPAHNGTATNTKIDSLNICEENDERGQSEEEEEALIDNSEILTLAASTLHQLEEKDSDDDDHLFNQPLHKDNLVSNLSNEFQMMGGNGISENDHYKNKHASSLTLQERVDVEDEYLSKLTIDTLRSFQQQEEMYMKKYRYVKKTPTHLLEGQLLKKGCG